MSKKPGQIQVEENHCSFKFFFQSKIEIKYLCATDQKNIFLERNSKSSYYKMGKFQPKIENMHKWALVSVEKLFNI